MYHFNVIFNASLKLSIYFKKSWNMGQWHIVVNEGNILWEFIGDLFSKDNRLYVSTITYDYIEYI